uniref:Uncharacterized protein n=1 Tax=Avena sativa TaxID=4498 RepID=A0ACD5WBP2_AVESA
MGGDSIPEFLRVRTRGHDYGLVTVASASAMRHGIPSPEASSSSRGTAGPRQRVFHVRHRAVRIRNSAIYSDRPRRSWQYRGGRAQQPANSRVEEEDSDEASSNELGPTISDASKFETLSLNDSPPALDSTDRAVVDASDMGTGLPDSTIVAPPAAEEALSRRSEERSTADLLLDQPTFDSVEGAMEYFCNSLRVARAAQYKALPLSRQSSLDKFEAERVLVPPHQAQPVPAQEQASAVAAQGRYEGSKEKTAENGQKWMCEEVWMAFQNYREKKDLMEFDYEFEELKCQCFHVENYCKIFHHFNFTVKMKEPGSSEWISTLFFAEVKEILTRTIYFCCPLEPDEYGNCYACKNQRMDHLQHPIIGAFDRGSPYTVFPFMEGSDISSDDDDEPMTCL